MSIVEWDCIPFDLVTPQGQMDWNEPANPGDPLYLLVKESCQALSSQRVTKDNIPQKDGSILHKRFRTGYEITLKLSYWDDEDAPACAASLVSMHDVLMRHLRSILNESGRLIYTPSGQAARFFDEVRWLREVTTEVQSGHTEVTFALDTPFPYALDFAQITTEIDTSPTTLTNTGSAPMYPVIKVDGPTCGFTIINYDSFDDQGDPLQIVYSSSFPGAQCIGAGDYAEIDTFRDVIYLNGDQDNLKDGIDIERSDFFALEVGPNDIVIVGEGTNPAPTVTFLWASAWA
jgi:phage-related protein